MGEGAGRRIVFWLLTRSGEGARAGGDFERLLTFNGMGPGEGERVVVSGVRDVAGVEGGVVAVMCAPAAFDSASSCACSDGTTGASFDANVSSPLLELISRGGVGGKGRKRVVGVLLTESNVYVAVWDGGLRFAEAFPERDVDSLLYCLTVLGRRFDLGRFSIVVGGVGADGVADALRPYSGKVRVV